MGSGDETFRFDAGSKAFYLSLDGFDATTTDLAVGATRTVPDVDAAEVNVVIWSGDRPPRDGYEVRSVGDVAITRHPDAPATVIPLPAAAPLRLAALCGPAATRRRSA